MELPDTLDPEFIDQYVKGCAFHNDPTCLCDVDRSKFVVGDGPYVFPTEILAAYDGGGNWLLEALREVDRNQGRAYVQARLDEGHGEMRMLMRDVGLEPVVEAILASHSNGCKGWREIAAKFDIWEDAVQQVAYLLCVPSPSSQKAKPLALRQKVIAMYEAGASTTECRQAIEAGGIKMDQSTVCNWVKRHSDRWARENPEKLQNVPGRPEYKARKAAEALASEDVAA